MMVCSDSSDSSAVRRHSPPAVRRAERTVRSHASMRAVVTSATLRRYSGHASRHVGHASVVTAATPPSSPRPRLDARCRHIAAVVDALLGRRLVGRLAQQLAELGQVAVRVE